MPPCSHIVLGKAVVIHSSLHPGDTLLSLSAPEQCLFDFTLLSQQDVEDPCSRTIHVVVEGYTLWPERTP